ncbi:hypothetical protein L1281_000354 [Neisseria sp. HSC-16F19]|nr:hypothetical protein [Neisseria sp. HSC-16F19]MCP2039784.1 hypothetical protein [Neisseria sp. HSC-16F19]
MNWKTVLCGAACAAALTAPAQAETVLRLQTIYEPSAAQQLADGRILVAEDEAKTVFSLLTVNADGSWQEDAAAAHSLRASLPQKLDDVEALAIDARGRLYAATSHSTDKQGRRQADRERLVRFSIHNNRATDWQQAVNIKDALMADKTLQAALRQQGAAVDFAAINLEAMAYDPNTQRLLLGLREPLAQGRTLLLAITNPDAMFERRAAPQFALVALWDLQKGGLRSLEYHPPSGTFYASNEVLSASTGRPVSQLWHWSGKAGEAPQALDGLAGLKNAEALAWLHRDGRWTLLALGDEGSRKKQRPARYVVVEP